MKTLKLIGYWRQRTHNPIESVPEHLRPHLDKRLWQPDTSSHKYPWPGDLIDPFFWKNNGLKEDVIAYLKQGHPCNHYRGFSTCRLCGEMLSSFERTDGVWIWPDKLEHYVEEHDVILPMEFLSTVRIPPPEVSVRGQTETQPGEIFDMDDSFWIDWWQKTLEDGFETVKKEAP